MKLHQCDGCGDQSEIVYDWGRILISFRNFTNSGGRVGEIHFCNACRAIVIAKNELAVRLVRETYRQLICNKEIESEGI